MKKFYHKLVRDCIPEIIAAAGKRCETRVLSEGDYAQALRAKLVEEALEAQAAGDRDALIGELADVVEVMEALMVAEGMSWAQVRAVQGQKRRLRGGFEGRVELGWVEEGEED
jgi:predicted house-cleaning noncanonical NTP pyrophosphatase (MazG superfamily)